MRIIIDIGHPAHVHLFRNFALEMMKMGHDILLTCRQKEFEIELLESSGLKYKCLGKHFRSTTGKIFGLFKINLQLLLISIGFKPDLFISHGSVYAAQVAWLCRKAHISLEDSANMEQVKLYKPFTKVILTPDILPDNFGSRQVRYKSYHEIAYLHPKYYVPNPEIFNDLNINRNEAYCVVRFVSWKATHDTRQKGFSNEEKQHLIEYLRKHYRVFITSESRLPEEYQKYRLDIPPDRMHDALHYASLYVGEGATMAAEAGVLGTPAIYVNSIIRYYCEDLSEYGLVFPYRDFGGVLEKLEDMRCVPETAKEWNKRRLKMLSEKVDLTALLVWFVNNWPESFKTAKRNPAFQEEFMIGIIL